MYHYSGYLTLENLDTQIRLQRKKERKKMISQIQCGENEHGNTREGGNIK